MKKTFEYIGVLLVIISIALIAYFFEDLQNLSDQLASSTYQADQISSPNFAVNNTENNSSEVSYEIIEVANNLFVPWSIAFTSQDRFLIAERNGYIKEVINDELNENPLIQFTDVRTSSEEGLMGLAVDPDYQENGYLYACYAYTSENGFGR